MPAYTNSEEPNERDTQRELLFDAYLINWRKSPNQFAGLKLACEYFLAEKFDERMFVYALVRSLTNNKGEDWFKDLTSLWQLALTITQGKIRRTRDEPNSDRKVGE